MKRWVKTLFTRWATGDLKLPLDAAGNVAFDDRADATKIRDFGQGKQLCAQLPSVVNYVSECDCYAEPMCESSIEHKYTFFVGTKAVVSDLSIRSPVPVACSYFRQLEVLANESKAILGYTPYTDITHRLVCSDGTLPSCYTSTGQPDRCEHKFCSNPYTGATEPYNYYIPGTSGMCVHKVTNVRTPTHCAPEADGTPNRNGRYGKRLVVSPGGGFNVRVKEISSIPRPHPLRRDLENGMVKNWTTNLDDPDIEQGVYQAYFDKCAPSDCYYDKPQAVEPVTVITILLGILGGLATLFQGAVHGVVNAITALMGVKRLDIVQLNDDHDKELRKELGEEEGGASEGAKKGARLQTAVEEPPAADPWIEPPQPSQKQGNGFPALQQTSPVRMQQQQQQQQQQQTMMTVQQPVMMVQQPVMVMQQAPQVVAVAAPLTIAPGRIREI